MMDWEEAERRISKSIKNDMDINTHRSTHRKVEKVDNLDYKIRIGTSNIISVTMEILEGCWFYSKNNHGGKYDTTVFQKLYKAKYRNHPCWVHVIGMIFVKAGVAKAVYKKSRTPEGYQLL
jgi:hypothetical protein